METKNRQKLKVVILALCFGLIACAPEHGELGTYVFEEHVDLWKECVMFDDDAIKVVHNFPGIGDQDAWSHDCQIGGKACQYFLGVNPSNGTLLEDKICQ